MLELRAEHGGERRRGDAHDRELDHLGDAEGERDDARELEPEGREDGEVGRPQGADRGGELVGVGDRRHRERHLALRPREGTGQRREAEDRE